MRPARAERRSEWSGPDGTRPLTEEGRTQAKGMADWLSQFPIDSLACGPALHHRETLAPLAQALGKQLLVDDRFDSEAPRNELVQRALELGEAGAIVCLSRPILQEVMGALIGPASFDLDSPCERGGAWLIEGEPRRATYFAPRGAARDLGEPIAPLEALTLSKSGSGAAAAEESGQSSRFAILDMGSTSFHLLVAEWTPENEIRRIGRDRVMLRMGSELARSETISPDLLERSLDAVQNLCAFAKEHKADKLVAVGTAALREASNGPEVVRQIESVIGGPVHLLSGEDEALIVHRAIRARIDVGHSRGRDVHVGLDLGGGSLEIIVGRGREVLLAKSLPLGVTRLHGMIAPSEVHQQDELRALRHAIREELNPLLEEIKALDPKHCIAVGGTARALCRVLLREQRAAGSLPDAQDATKKNTKALEVRGRRLERSELARLGRELAAQTLAERLDRPGVSSRRADLLPFGAEILASVLSLLEMRSLTVCDWGLREGVLLNLLDAESARPES
ncbi:MAG: histidine phosphatase family protein [Myxococcota bacterium]